MHSSKSGQIQSVLYRTISGVFTLEQLAKRAYERHCKAYGKARVVPIPWNDIPAIQHDAWVAVAKEFEHDLQLGPDTGRKLWEPRFGLHPSKEDFMTTREAIQYRPEELAEKAYSAFCSAQSGVDHNGQRHIPWQNLPQSAKAGWMAATHVVVTNANAIDGRTGLTEREAELAGKSPAAAREAEQVAEDQRRADATAKHGEEVQDAKEAKLEKNGKAHGAHR